MEAAYYTKLKLGKVKCNLCPHACILSEGIEGICRVRKNTGGVLNCITANSFSAIHLDPIEKKPLYHFFPGKQILSIGGLGCNMRCEWCQNCSISQTNTARNSKELISSEVVELAQSEINNIGIAFTYNEPLINYETNLLIAKQANSEGLKNVLVTNGYINDQPLHEMLQFIDAVNLDIKSFNRNLHYAHTKADLEIVLRNAKKIFDSGTHLEITMLVVPGVSDSLREFEGFVNWISSELSIEIPLHISRYFPQHKYNADATSLEVLERFAEIANASLHYVYIGNVQSNIYKNTYCPVCTNEIVSRNAYEAVVVGADSMGYCTECGKKVFKNT